MEAGAEPFQEGDVPGVPERFASRVRPNGQIQSRRAEQHPQLRDRYPAGQATLDPAVL